MSDHFLWRHFITTWRSIKPSAWPVSFSRTSAWPIRTASLPVRHVWSFSSSPSVENTNRRVTLVAFVALHLHWKWTGCFFVEMWKRSLIHGCYKAAVCGSVWHKVTTLDNVLQWHHRINSSCTTFYVLSAFPVLKNKRVIYIWEKEKMKKVQPDVGREEVRGWRRLFRTEQTYHKLFKDFFKQHCAAVGEGSFSAHLTEWQSNATLWMKLCLISSWMQTSQIDTHREVRQVKQTGNVHVSQKQQIDH